MRYFTAPGKWVPVIDLTGPGEDELVEIAKQATALLEAMEKEERSPEPKDGYVYWLRTRAVKPL